MQNTTVNILGTEYTIRYDRADDKELAPKDRAGYCYYHKKLIVIEDLNTDEDWKDEEDLPKEEYRKELLRHEITHAFMYESGLGQNSADISAWATNEEMIDWFAKQSPKIFKVFQELNIL